MYIKDKRYMRCSVHIYMHIYIQALQLTTLLARFAGSACYHAGVVGHVCLEFVTLQDAAGVLCLWAVDLTLGITTSLISFQLFDYLSGESKLVVGFDKFSVQSARPIYCLSWRVLP